MGTVRTLSKNVVAQVSISSTIHPEAIWKLKIDPYTFGNKCYFVFIAFVLID